MPIRATFIQHSFGSPSLGNQRRKRKRVQIEKEIVKLLVFADGMIPYIRILRMPPENY